MDGTSSLACFEAFLGDGNMQPGMKITGLALSVRF